MVLRLSSLASVSAQSGPSHPCYVVCFCNTHMVCANTKGPDQSVLINRLIWTPASNDALNLDAWPSIKKSVCQHDNST